MDRCVMDSPAGRLLIEADEAGICAVRRTDLSLSDADTPLLTACVAQLRAYFDGTLTAFDLPLHLSGTVFQRRAWDALCRIPYGETRTYGQQAAMLGNPKASRAVGGANHHNPVMIIVPCHRVIGSGGQLTGYAGGLDMKAWLLAHEQAHAIK